MRPEDQELTTGNCRSPDGRRSFDVVSRSAVGSFGFVFLGKTAFLVAPGLILGFVSKKHFLIRPMSSSVSISRYGLRRRARVRSSGSAMYRTRGAYAGRPGDERTVPMTRALPRIGIYVPTHVGAARLRLGLGGAVFRFRDDRGRAHAVGVAGYVG